MFNKMRRFGLLASLVLLSACANHKYTNVTALPTTVAPVAAAAQNLPPYRVQVGDVLDIKFYLNPEFDETVTVRPDGKISTKLIQDLLVYNETVSQVNDQVKQSYQKELKDPQVTTSVRSFAPIHIYVSGEVFSPGEFIVVGRALTLTQAIARAGGIKNSGDGKQVIVIRRGAGEQGQVYLANYDAATQGADPAADARLAPDDVLFVPKTGAALNYVQYQQNFQQFTNFGTGASIGYSP